MTNTSQETPKQMESNQTANYIQTSRLANVNGLKPERLVKRYLTFFNLPHPATATA